jgi:hypothetical protein
MQDSPAIPAKLGKAARFRKIRPAGLDEFRGPLHYTDLLQSGS